VLLPLTAAALVHSAGPPLAVRVVADVDYVPEATYEDDRDKLDLYLPEGRSGFPVVLWLHGGALWSGSKAGGAQVGRTLAAAGVGAVVANYRLSPKVHHPAHAQDAARAVAWAIRHLKEHGGDPAALFLAGHSAGGYLASLLALDGRHLAAQGLRPADLAGVIPVSAFFWVEEVAPSRPKYVWGGDPAAWPAASPASYLQSAAPPFLIVYADGDEDWRRAQNERMAAGLREAGHAGVEIRQVRGRDHMTINDHIAPGDEVADLLLDFVARRVGARR
jgi:acetyl esterase/lipase